MTRAPPRPMAMIARPPIALEPIAPVPQPGHEHRPDRHEGDADAGRADPLHQQLVLEAGRRLAHELEDRLRGPRAEHRVQRDPGRGQQPDPRRAQDAAIAPQVQALRSQLAGSPPRHPTPAPWCELGHAPAVDGERQDVDAGVHRKPTRPNSLEDRPGGDDAEADAQQRRCLEARHRAAADRLITGGGERDVAQDRRDGGSRRGALQQARPADDPQVDGDGRDQDRDDPEDRARSA